ncbi:MAG: NAD-dependent epimerase/dehydratase [Actinophytocola sp.]|uniref:NAD-dependent epimerase/dehydratase family protein n=1 Tax=Actinophytocola sp. TaxID=1872138 RepID=UPI003C790AC5
MSRRPVIAVLGASGFIGTAVMAALAPRPVTVRAVARGPALVPENALADYEVHTADLTVAANLAEVVAGADAVIHLVLDGAGWRGAGNREHESASVGVMRDLLDCLRGQAVERPPVVVFAGSVTQVGPPPRTPIDGTEPDRPMTDYDRQKLAAEGLLKAASADRVVLGVSLRLPTVFGLPTDRDRGVLAAMTRRALAGEALTMWHDGSVRRELLDVEDVAAAFVAALDHADALAGRHWLLGNDRSDRIGDVFTAIAELVAEHTGRPRVPVCSVPPPAHAQRTDFESVAVDSSAFRAATGWRPRTPQREALARMVMATAARP